MSDSRCPICRARLRSQSQCPRCQSELRLVLALERASERQTRAACQALGEGDWNSAEGHLARAIALYRTPFNRALHDFIVDRLQSGISTIDTR